MTSEVSYSMFLIIFLMQITRIDVYCRPSIKSGTATNEIQRKGGFNKSSRASDDLYCIQLQKLTYQTSLRDCIVQNQCIQIEFYIQNVVRGSSFVVRRS